MSEEELNSTDNGETAQEVIEGAETETPGTPSGREKPVTPFDPRKPNRLTQGQLNVLSGIVQHVANDWTVEMGKTLRGEFTIKVKSFTQERFGSFISFYGGPTCCYQVELVPKRMPMISILDHGLVFSTVDCFLGGTGEIDLEQRDLTHVEWSIADRLIETMSRLLALRWRKLGALNPNITLRLDDVTRIETIPDKEIVLLIVMGIESDQVAYGDISLCIPFSVLQDYLKTIDALEGVEGGEERDLTEWKKQLKKEIVDVEVSLPVVLGEADIPIGDIMNLQEDDVIVIDRKITDALEVRVGSNAAIRGNVGVYKNKLALKILEIPNVIQSAEEVTTNHD